MQGKTRTGVEVMVCGEKSWCVWFTALVRKFYCVYFPSLSLQRSGVAKAGNSTFVQLTEKEGTR